MRSVALVLMLVGVGLVCLAGCEQKNSLSGAVTYNGEPVEKGSLTFASADLSGPGFGAKIVDGHYEADKVQLGSHVVLVRGVADVATLSHEEFLKQRESNRYGVPIDYIPEDTEGNRQSVEIKGGAQTLDFNLTGPPRPTK